MLLKFFISSFVFLSWKYCIEGAVMSTLGTVDLSDRNLTREDFFTKLQHNVNMPQANELILRGNRFDSFVDCSTKLDNLRTLDLSHNNLKKFFFLCQGEYNLQTLNVSYNQIEYINDKALNHRVVRLKVLDVSYNNISAINDTMLQHLSNLEFLSMASNPIKSNIDDLIFQNLTSLKHLNLRNISAEYLSPVLFEKLTNLTYLDLSDNPIEEVPSLPTNIRVLFISGTHIANVDAFNMPQLRKLVLDNSQNLKSVLFNNFENLMQLEILSMGNCRALSDIQLTPTDSPFLPKLSRLNLQNCSLQSLSPEFKSMLENTAILDLQNNPWKCDCKMEWIHAMNLTSDLDSSFKCASPEKHVNRLLRSLPSDALICEEPLEDSQTNSVDFVSRGVVKESLVNENMGTANDIIYPLIWVGFALVITGLSAGVVYYSRDCLGQWITKVRHRTTDSVSYTNVVESNNDLVRILPVGSDGNEHSEV